MLDAGWWLFPVSGELHWTLAAIRGLKKPNFDENNPVLAMLHFDSLAPGTGTHDSTTIASNLSAFSSMAFFYQEACPETESINGRNGATLQESERRTCQLPKKENAGYCSPERASAK